MFLRYNFSIQNALLLPPCFRQALLVSTSKLFYFPILCSYHFILYFQVSVCAESQRSSSSHFSRLVSKTWQLFQTIQASLTLVLVSSWMRSELKKWLLPMSGGILNSGDSIFPVSWNLNLLHRYDFGMEGVCFQYLT